MKRKQATMLEACGACPNQFEGQVGPDEFYFRARHGGYEFTVARTLAAAVWPDTQEKREQVLFNREGSRPGAGWWGSAEAAAFVRKQIERYGRSVGVAFEIQEGAGGE